MAGLVKHSIVFHHYLFSIYPVLYLYSKNIDITSPIDIFPAIIFSFTISIIFYLLINKWFADKYKSSLIVSFILFTSFSYGHLFNFAKSHIFFLNNQIIFIGVFFLLILFTFKYLLTISNEKYFHINNLINVFILVLLFINIFSIISYNYFRIYKKPKHNNNENRTIEDLISFNQNFPDIYYIVLDSYSNNRVLNKYFDYNNETFTDSLKKLGFMVQKSSYSNYPFTYGSLTSSLNMNYLDALSDKNKLDRFDRGFLKSKIKNNNVLKKLKSVGYEYIHMKTSYLTTQDNEFADLEIETVSVFGNEFNRILLSTTIFKPIVTFLEIILGPENILFRNKLRDQVLITFKKISYLAKASTKQPRFIFSHIISPHPPFLFYKDGSSRYDLSNGHDLNNHDKQFIAEAYIEQLIFINSKVLDIINDIITKSFSPPIIIIQGDHGLSFTSDWIDPPEWSNPSQEFLEQQFAIIDACYIPQKTELFKSNTPVNTFRKIFNLYFESDYEILPKKQYFSHFNEYPYEFIEVTDQLRK